MLNLKEPKVVVIMPAYNAAKTLEKTYRCIPPQYFPKVSSINFRHSVVYGIQTLWTLLRYILQRWGLRKDWIFISKKNGKD